MSEFKQEGVVIFIGETEQATATFKKRLLVLETDSDSNYPQKVAFEFTQEATAKLDKISVGEIATVYFNLRGRDWTNKEGVVKYFNTIQGWRVETGAKQKAAIAPMEVPADCDDLPF